MLVLTALVITCSSIIKFTFRILADAFIQSNLHWRNKMVVNSHELIVNIKLNLINVLFNLRVRTLNT